MRRSRTEYRKAIVLDPRDAKAHQNLAIIPHAQGQTKEGDAEEQQWLPTFAATTRIENGTMP
jgi:Flp pilus assembly protein TadD